jgi:hypothetical protein
MTVPGLMGTDGYGRLCRDLRIAEFEALANIRPVPASIGQTFLSGFRGNEQSNIVS